MILTTWNMQGSNANTEAKWTTYVRQLLGPEVGSDVVCLQECGGVPGGTTLLGQVPTPPPVNGKGQPMVRVYSWGGTRSRGSNTIFHHTWDTGGGRVNTAVVCRGNIPAPYQNMVHLAWGNGGAQWRPALGVQVPGAPAGWVYSFHAISPAGPDTAHVVQTLINDAVRRPWWLAGDFNREPGTLVAIPPFLGNGNVQVLQTPVATHPAPNPTRRLDYLIRWVTNAGGAEFRTSASNPFSDHFPVTFTIR